MEAPNKLFIKPEQIKVEMIPGGELPNVGIQYIRKTKLIEWLNEMKSDLMIPMNIDKVIDYIKAL